MYAQVGFVVPDVVHVIVIVSMTQYAEKFNLQIPREHFHQRSLKIQSPSLKLYVRTGRSSPYNFPFVSLVYSKSKQISTKDCI